jgi:hypothetical protein
VIVVVNAILADFYRVPKTLFLLGGYRDWYFAQILMDFSATSCSVEENMSSLQIYKNIGIWTCFNACWLGWHPLLKQQLEKGCTFCAGPPSWLLGWTNGDFPSVGLSNLTTWVQKSGKTDDVWGFYGHKCAQGKSCKMQGCTRVLNRAFLSPEIAKGQT